MSSKQGEKPNEGAFPPKDFKEFIDRIQGANAVGDRFLDSIMPCRSQCVLPPATEVRRSILIIEALLERRRDLDAHYGWVLASDATLVYKSMGGNSENGAAWARQWMKGIYDEYERVGRALLAAKPELDILVRRAESERNS